jgi:hypothetical protein
METRSSERCHIEELQTDLGGWLTYYNKDRTHQGKMCCGRTPIQTLVDGRVAWHDKNHHFEQLNLPR